MQKKFKYQDGELFVAFGQGVVRIDNNERLWVYINTHPPEKTKALTGWIQQTYAEAFGGRLEISDHSLMMEIWGHIYFEYFLLRNERLGKFFFPFGLYERLVASCEAIDCGERGLDGNRWLWDLLGIFTPLVGKLIPRNSLR